MSAVMDRRGPAQGRRAGDCADLEARLVELADEVRTMKGDLAELLDGLRWLRKVISLMRAVFCPLARMVEWLGRRLLAVALVVVAVAAAAGSQWDRAVDALKSLLGP